MILLLLQGCGKSYITSYHGSLSDYQSGGHYRAFVAAKDVDETSWAWGYATGAQSALEAVSVADEICRTQRLQRKVQAECITEALGSVLLTQEEQAVLGAHISAYQASPGSYN